MSIIRCRRINHRDIDTLPDQLHQLRCWYGPDLLNAQYIPTLFSLINEGALASVLVERCDSEQGTEGNTLLGFGVTGFLDLALARDLVNSSQPLPLGEHLYHLEQQGSPCFLRPAQQALCNGADGLAQVFLHFYTPHQGPDTSATQQAIKLMYDSFRISQCGHHTRLLLHPKPSADTGLLDSLIAHGYSTIDANPNIIFFDLDKLKETPFHPLVMVIRTALPRLGFTQAEKDLLSHALFSRSDEELALDLQLSIETVRKRWRNIYQRFSDHPEIQLFGNEQSPAENKTRGRGKRPLVIQYISDHLEEIRPFSL